MLTELSFDVSEQSFHTFGDTIEMEDIIGKLEPERIHEVTSKEASDFIDNWVVSTVADETKEHLIKVNEGLAGASGSIEEFIDPQSFSLWVSNKVGKKNDTLGSIAYIFSTFDVMEIAQNVFCIGKILDGV